jgi:hypothetical protein
LSFSEERESKLKNIELSEVETSGKPRVLGWVGISRREIKILSSIIVKFV